MVKFLEDEASDNEDEIDYYSSQRDLQMEVEDEDHEGISFADPELEANSRLDNEASEIHNLGITEQSPTPSVNNYTCNPRNLVWRVKIWTLFKTLSNSKETLRAHQKF
ncbi:hypothetical protein HF086_009357 [Spodoptera exigua]|uniref:Uncharacterized protein n=1 Tax=Spodoptera exigua TaxID=7107 RepID=A0A922MJQ5_SPOEX|nr:hypothetical protein HF086_009357 [Spodoptera exigua]